MSCDEDLDPIGELEMILDAGMSGTMTTTFRAGHYAGHRAARDWMRESLLSRGLLRFYYQDASGSDHYALTQHGHAVFARLRILMESFYEEHCAHSKPEPPPGNAGMGSP